MTSSKESVRRLTSILRQKEICHVVFSPGSRNAPLIISIANDPYFTCYNIPDERTAGFFALGLALQSKNPVVLCCTSGSAAINYGPALVEAFYQKIPLIAITADRPQEWIDQRAGQTMRQKDLYSNYIKLSVELRQEVHDNDDLWYNDRLINQAIETAKLRSSGPVHINVPLKEPLYNQVNNDGVSPKIFNTSTVDQVLSDSEVLRLKSRFGRSKKVLILCGQHQLDDRWIQSVRTLSSLPSVVILSELTSNVFGEGIISCIDRTINHIDTSKIKDYTPDLLITCGYSLVSKKIRFLLREMDVAHHWHVDPYDTYIDTYKSLTELIPITIDRFVDQIIDEGTYGHQGNYKKLWYDLDSIRRERHAEYLKDVIWSDLGVTYNLMSRIPDKTHLHMANSTSVRYAQLFDANHSLIYQCNRGVSGIDGCTSTAIGYSYLSDDLNVLLTGDVAFLYDSNALWHHHLPDNLKIIVLNNSGGNIFRVIPGPATTDHLEQHFESHHTTKANHLAITYGVNYLSADDYDSFHQGLDILFSKPDSMVIFEVFTPRMDNDKILKEYFNYIKG